MSRIAWRVLFAIITIWFLMALLWVFSVWR